MGLQSAIYSAISGLNANVRKATVAADNIANVGTPGFIPDEVVTVSGGATEDPVSGNVAQGARAVVRPAVKDATVTQDIFHVDLGQEFVSLAEAQRAYESNMAVIRTAADMMRSLLDEQT